MSAPVQNSHGMLSRHIFRWCLVEYMDAALVDMEGLRGRIHHKQTTGKNFLTGESFMSYKAVPEILKLCIVQKAC